MIRFNNDYNHAAHPAILEELVKQNSNAYGGYGLDELCDKATAAIQQYLQRPEAQIHYLIGGTGVNYTVIASALRPYQSVICAETGHIHVHETGAVEHTGHKIQALPSVNGKIQASQIEAVAREFRFSPVPEHITEPKMVYISQPTEFGTLYSLQELQEIRKVCDEYRLYLFVDGARLGYGMGASENDVTLKDLGRLCDVFYIGGTKCGAMFGEAVVLTNPELFPGFRSSMKQNGGMLAKGFLLGLQFETLFRDGLYFRITKKAVEQAMQIRDAFAEKGIAAYIESPTNQQFVVVNKAQKEKLAEKFIFEEEGAVDEEHSIVRFCTSWCTTDEEIRALIEGIREL